MTCSTSKQKRAGRLQLPLPLLALPLLPLVLLVLLLAAGPAAAKQKQRCGNALGAVCCQAWGNTCIDNSLTCCGGACIAAPFNASDPARACGAPRPLCAFSAMLERTREWSSANAFLMTALSTAMYPSTFATPDDDEQWSRAAATWASGLGFTNATFFSAHSKLHEVDTEGMCAADAAGNVVVAFRGTSSMTDAATDLDVVGSLHPRRTNAFSSNGSSSSSSGGGGHVGVHDGFLDAYKPVRDAARACARLYMDAAVAAAAAAPGNGTGGAARPQPMLWVTGHSLGAALATLAALDLANDGLHPVVYTLGSPRVGDKDFVALYDVEAGLKNQTFRMVHRNDPVPRMPADVLGYRHVGSLIDVNVTRGTCQSSSSEFPCTSGPLCTVNDHYTDMYLNATFACVARDAAIDTRRCPVEALLEPINYDEIAGTPSKPAPLANGTQPEGSKQRGNSARPQRATGGLALTGLAGAVLALVLLAL